MDNILCVIVLYKSALELSKTYQSFFKANSNLNLFVYDNSPQEQIINRHNTIYIHDAQNSGLSVAYNKAAKYAQKNGYQWLLLLDQDSDFSGITIENYSEAISKHPNVKIFAPKVKCGEKYMSPCVMRHKTGFLVDEVPDKCIPLSKYSIINSGMCVNVDAMIKCGGYKEDVFLDYSDHQFIERFRKLYPTCFIIDKEVNQSFSTVTDDKASTINRYKLFCKSLKAFERHCFADNFWFFTTVLKRGVSICWKKHTLKPLKYFFTEYL